MLFLIVKYLTDFFYVYEIIFHIFFIISYCYDITMLFFKKTRINESISNQIYSDLFTFVIMLVAIITLVRNDKHKK